MSKITGAYTKDYKDGFKAAYILGPTVALAQLHEWRQEELDAKKGQYSQEFEVLEPYERETPEDRRQRLDHEAGEEEKPDKVV